MKFHCHVKQTLLQLIEQMSENPAPFVVNPEKDFSRHRKLGFSDMLQLLISMETGSIKSELIKFFRCDPNMPSVSAFVQQREKIKSTAFTTLLKHFNQSFGYKKYKGHRLIACDGTVLTIPLEPGHDEYTYRKCERQRDYYQIHLNTLYDLCTHTYQDIIINPRNGNNERTAFCDMLLRGDFEAKTIFIADRGYEGYSLLALLNQKGMYYVIRAKDNKDGGIIKSYDVPKEGEYDKSFNYIYTYSRSNEVFNNPDIYKRVRQVEIPYFISRDNPYVKMFLRIVKIKLPGNKYVCLLTNIPKEKFSAAELKELYRMRWGIETSYRELKYTIGATSLHSKKEEFIKQEITARLILYNFCEIIAGHIKTENKKTTYRYQLNHSAAVLICRWFLKLKKHESPPDVEALIAKELLPLRPGRNHMRNLGYHSAVAFCYRAC